MHGGYIGDSTLTQNGLGSSPHAWGLLQQTGHGKKVQTVHPHMRGVYGNNAQDDDDTLRFIPTYVGVTCSSDSRLKTTTVHPHMRGVYFVRLTRRRFPVGSSPHAWGLPFPREILGGLQRYIPTCVGFTAGLLTADTSKTGTSPHAWGLQDGKRAVLHGVRFIPTCVGFTPRRSPSPGQNPVHPHVHGVYMVPFVA